MLFSSIFFICIFLPVTLVLYYLVPWKLKNTILLLVSLVFYAWGEPVYVLLMIFSIVFNYLAGLQLSYLRRLREEGRRKFVFIFTVVINLGILGFFKYFDFLLSSFNSIFSAHLPLSEIALPIGISFYTFQILSYVIDVYRGNVPVQKNIIDFGAYITMFPQLIAGPIVRYDDIRRQLKHRTLSMGKLSDGVVWFIKGLTKKVLLANNIGMLFDAVFAIDASERAVFTTWLGIIAYAFQIYFDFSGYSDMAIGLGKMLGFDFIQNFDHPYLATSAGEFWNRWHISLASWFKEYVYIPLGGSRVSSIKNIRNLFVVWALTGLWHGAAWNFILWGIYFGILIILEKYALGRILKKLPAVLQHLYGLVVVNFGWYMFSASDLQSMSENIKAGFGGFGTAFIDSTSLYYLTSNIILLIICALCATPLIKNLYKRFCTEGNMLGKAIGVICFCIAFVLCIGYLVNATYNPFLYFRF